MERDFLGVDQQRAVTSGSFARKVAPSGLNSMKRNICIAALISILLGAFARADAQPNLLIGNTNFNQVLKCAPNGSNLEPLTTLGTPTRGVRYDRAAHMVYYWAGGGIRRMDLDGSNDEEFISASNSVESNRAFDIDYQENKLLYFTITDELRSRTLNGSLDEKIADIPTADFNLALDHANRHIYYSASNRIRRIGVDGSGDTLVITSGTGSESIYDIELDIESGHIYYLQDTFGNNSLKRVDFDGSNDTTLFSNASMSAAVGFSLDVEQGRVYLVNSSDNIVFSCDVDGSGCATLVGAPHGINFPQDIEFVPVDATAPGAPIIDSPVNVSITNESTPTISGTAERLSSVSILINGSSVGSVSANQIGAWAYTPSTPLSDGAYSLTAVATDRASNASAVSGSVGITIDTVAPTTPTITAPSESDYMGGLSALRGTAEAGTTLALSINGASAGSMQVGGSGTWEVIFASPLAGGTYAATALSTDAAGNSSSADSSLTVPSCVSVDMTSRQRIVDKAAEFESLQKRAQRLTSKLSCHNSAKAARGRRNVDRTAKKVRGLAIPTERFVCNPTPAGCQEQVLSSLKGTLSLLERELKNGTQSLTLGACGRGKFARRAKISALLTNISTASSELSAAIAELPDAMTACST